MNVVLHWFAATIFLIWFLHGVGTYDINLYVGSGHRGDYKDPRTPPVFLIYVLGFLPPSMMIPGT